MTCFLSLLIAGTAVRSLAEEPAAVSVAGFYAVDESGRSAPEDPVASGFARAPVRSPVSAPVPARPQPAVPRRVVVKVRGAASRLEPDPAAAWRCESTGFYYAADGRCVVPAYQLRPGPPPRALPRR